jgi:ssDNA-binding Zn-finger/Zn-ribbon topoisomerase 1
VGEVPGIEVDRVKMTEPDNFSGVTILQCPKCNHEWMEKMSLPQPLDRFVALMKAWEICPKCGNKKGIMMLLDEKFREAYKKIKGVWYEQRSRERDP